MSRYSLRLAALSAVAGLAAVVAVPQAASAKPSQATGPSTTTGPYVLPVADGVQITSLLTVDDGGSAENGYEMVGIPDGLGARTGPKGTALVTMNHELQPNTGIVRRHGQQGSFISELAIGK